MTKRILMGGFLTLAISSQATAATTTAATPAVVTDDQVQRVHRRAIVVDTHADTLWRVLDKGDDITVRSSKGHIDIPRMIEGGLDAEFFVIWPQEAYYPNGESCDGADGGCRTGEATLELG